MKSFQLSDNVFDRLNRVLLLGVVSLIAYPLLFILSASVSDPVAVGSGQMWLWPVRPTLAGYERIFENSLIWLGYRNTIMYTVVGTLLHLLLLLPCAYALSRKEVAGKKPIVWMILFTMLFNGGLIPTYLVIKALGMLDTIWAIVIPNAVGAWAMLVAHAFFKQSIPDELVEASKVDGASDFSIFVRVALPLSAPIIAVMALFHAVGLWNQYFNALIYLSDNQRFPLQLILRQILIVNEIGSGDPQAMMDQTGEVRSMLDKVKMAELIKYGVMIVSSLPLLIVYPFLQRFFVKGVLIGSIKG
ncbi:sugar ABC transporter permease [Paenibacillus sp. MY03]|uniref:carbohydrate ABC transporter permease n=1 Tax=Paenibacillus sp. MY03 TaxID=302980 RepID=UPI000B3CABC6|nr:carbohydrate ABC transporter permease [Paenibacillus sp. MY03]OUS77266.1 sugar ABC transporter permease [Paenibacillus sp. MY03]